MSLFHGEASGSFLKRWVVGPPIPSHLAHHERLSRVTGLAVLSSDALSSVAYATEEILRVLVLVSAGALAFSSWIAVAIASILAIVVFSYRQTIRAYPSGGGAYIVAHENLGEMPALIAAASLLIDYVLTVAVSIPAGVAAITSAFPATFHYRVEMTLACVLVLALGNLRGIRDSGRIFSVPTYFFIGGVGILCAIGLFRWATGSIIPVTTPDAIAPLGRPLTVFLLLTAFSNGCTAMTGVEAVSNGVPAFRPPESRNAVKTMGTMAVLAIGMFLGITLLAQAYQVVPSPTETVLSQLARGVSGGRGILYYLVQAGTMLILVLAANTAYADFPRLASILARDRFLPRQFMNQGDRLAFSNGILGLSAFAALLLIIFHGDTNALIPLYMIGVFVSFTASQTGMVVHWRRLKTPRWHVSAFINGLGAVVTFLVLAVVATTKFVEGAWIILILIPLNVWLFRATRRHYELVSAQLKLPASPGLDEPAASVVIVPVSGMHRAVVQALDYARTLSSDVRAVYVSLNDVTTEELKTTWTTWGRGVPLVVLQSPYRSLMEPLLEYLEQVRHEQNAFVTVVLPEFIPAHWWQAIFHNQSALLIKGALLFTPNTVVTSVPFHLSR